MEVPTVVVGTGSVGQGPVRGGRATTVRRVPDAGDNARGAGWARVPLVHRRPEGLSAAEVADREQRGLVNRADERTSRSLMEIARANLLTRFNAILGTMFVLILVFGAAQDGLFGFVLVTNALLGIVQEWRAKRTLDRLAVLSAPRARVVRDGAVRGDRRVGRRARRPARDPGRRSAGRRRDRVFLRRARDRRVAADRRVGAADQGRRRRRCCRAASSWPVPAASRRRGSAPTRTRRLATEARRFTLARSELVDGTNRILQLVQWAIVPTAILLAFSQFKATDSNRRAIAGVIAGVVAMIPEGLVLLTSLAFAVAAVTLARQRVLVQELPAVEGLARVDVVVLDKTGTITEGVMRFDALSSRSATTTWWPTRWARSPPTTIATRRCRRCAKRFRRRRAGRVRRRCRSRRRASGARRPSCAGHVGARRARDGVGRAPGRRSVRIRFERSAADGRRVLLALGPRRARRRGVAGAARGGGARGVRREDPRRRRRHDPATSPSRGWRARWCRATARARSARSPRVGIAGAEHPVDGRDLPEDLDALGEMLETTSVIGRVTPHQKRSIVNALQQRGHVVAMTGDGVNDALALKDADIGIAMGSGAPATRAVAQVVLLDGQFAAMPGVVAEGRRVIANVERVANLFVTKTVYAMLLAIAVGIARWPYPFLPRHLTIISSLTIGIPAFFLALGPEPASLRPGIRAAGAAILRPLGSRRVRGDLRRLRVRARGRRRVADGIAHRGDDRVARCRALDPRDPGPPVHARARRAGRRDGRLLRGHAGGPRCARLLRARDPAREARDRDRARGARRRCRVGVERARRRQPSRMPVSS